MHKHQLEQARKTVLHHKDNSTTVTTGHTSYRVELLKGSQYCRQCYKVLKETDAGKGLSAKEKKKKCRASRLGCSTCDEPICEDCWDSGYWRHEGMDLD